MFKRPSLMAVIQFVATEWVSYSLVVFLAVLAKTLVPILTGLLPGPPDLRWLAMTPVYALSVGATLALVCLPADIFIRWVMMPFGLFARQVVSITICVTAYEVWNKTSRVWDGGTERVVISIGAAAFAGIIAGCFRAWIRRPRRTERDLEIVFE